MKYTNGRGDTVEADDAGGALLKFNSMYIKPGLEELDVHPVHEPPAVMAPHSLDGLPFSILAALPMVMSPAVGGLTIVVETPEFPNGNWRLERGSHMDRVKLSHGEWSVYVDTYDGALRELQKHLNKEKP